MSLGVPGRAVREERSGSRCPESRALDGARPRTSIRPGPSPAPATAAGPPRRARRQVGVPPGHLCSRDPGRPCSMGVRSQLIGIAVSMEITSSLPVVPLKLYPRKKSWVLESPGGVIKSSQKQARSEAVPLTGSCVIRARAAGGVSRRRPMRLPGTRLCVSGPPRFSRRRRGNRWPGPLSPQQPRRRVAPGSRSPSGAAGRRPRPGPVGHCSASPQQLGAPRFHVTPRAFPRHVASGPSA